VIALVDQALGEIERGEAAAEALIAEQRLVHARAAVAERASSTSFQAPEDVIGVEHRVARHLAQAIGAVAEDVGQRAGEHAHLAVEGGHPPEALAVMLARGFLLDQA
jgi:hypothetical protein